MKSVYDIIRKPIITEQSMERVSNKVYVFEVERGSNKIEIKRAVEEIFKVKVKSVNTMNVLGKMKRQGVHSGYTPARKKAIVTLTPESKTIEIFEGMY